MNDDASSETARPERPAPPSKTPSWVMLGFVFGALFVWALPHREATPAQVRIEPSPTPSRGPAKAPLFTTIENVFAEWGHYAVWENDLTEVAFWNVEQSAYLNCYEVLRVGENYYFRTIPALTRPALTHGVKAASPLQFTEPQARRDEWLRDRNEQTFRAFTEAARQNIPAPGANPDSERK